MSSNQPSASDFEKATLRRLKRVEDWIDRFKHLPSGGGGVNSPIFVPAIGGNWDFTTDTPGWGQHQRVYGGGPYGGGGGGGVIEFDQIGISMQDGTYVSAFAGAFGIFTVPDGVNHVKMIPVWRIDGDVGDNIHFHGEMLGMDETGCTTSTYAAGDATIYRNLCTGVLSPQFVTAAQLESDTTAHEVIRVYADMDARAGGANLVAFMLGWQVYFSGPGVASGLVGQDYKQSTYTASVIDLGLTSDTYGVWVDVDATNAAITFTPAADGAYKVTFIFPHAVFFTGAGSADMIWKLTDGTNSSATFEDYRSVSQADYTITVLNLSTVFNWSASSHTVKLQKNNANVSGAISANSVYANDDYSPAGVTGLYMLVERL